MTTTTTKYAPVVQLKSGKVSGLVIGGANDDGLYFYQGIRYGRAERFCKPVPVEPWEGVYEATKPRAAFPQFGNVSSWATEQSEDAHFLNVWQPANSQTKSSRSVMFWIHGGGCEEGSAFKPSNDCQHLALQGDLVVVSINYRLGPLGFLHAGKGCPGNWALHDMLLALNWVKENIAVFGGNAADVTVFGESAGAFAVGALVLVEGVAGKLFHRAILSSGAPPRCIESPAEALTKTKLLADKLNIPQSENLKEMVTALKAIPFSQMQPPTYGDLGRNEWFRPVYGDELLPNHHIDLLQKANPRIDLLFGTVANEGTIFAVASAPKLMTASKLNTEAAYKAIVAMMHVQGLGQHAETIARFYTRKLNEDSSQNEFRMAIADALGDLCLLVSTILFAETIARNVPENRYYAYQLIQRPEPVDPKLPPWLGVIHGTNNKFLFTVPADETMTAETHRLSTEIIRAWANFAKTGRPGLMGGVQWEEAFVDRKNPVTRLLTLKWDDFRMVEGPHKEVVDFWRPILFQQKE